MPRPGRERGGDSSLWVRSEVEYESAPDQLLFDFFAAGTVLESGSNAISLDTKLTLWAMKKDLR